MEPSELLRHVTGSLERLGLRYFVTGSMATIFFGEPRFTNDIDVVVDLPAGRIRDFCAEFPQDSFYLEEESVRRAVSKRSQFNIIHPSSGLKVDVVIPAETDFNRSRFERVRSVRATPGRNTVFASPEDVILKKMEYYREGGSEKHLRDITGVLKVSGPQLDRAYIEQWSTRLGLAEIWAQVCAAAEGEGS
jgi:hypothetical protein